MGAIQNLINKLFKRCSHCWHYPDFQHYKVKNGTGKCKLTSKAEFLHADGLGEYVECAVREKCCICNKQIWSKFKVYNTQLAMTYPLFTTEVEQSFASLNYK